MVDVQVALKPVAVPDMQFPREDGTSDALYAMELALQAQLTRPCIPLQGPLLPMDISSINCNCPVLTKKRI